MKLLDILAGMMTALMLAACSADMHPDIGTDTEESVFVKGADISWVTEMEADGVRFYNRDGVETDCFMLMKELGMDAVRLRVWVNPENSYGKWSDQEDVVVKAKRAKEAGLEVMIDFHYSDFFADPGRQTKPEAWKGMNIIELKKAVGDHTASVLNALMNEGIGPRWIQIGNETRNGMLWTDGQLWTDTGDITDGWKNYAELSNAGYEAAKTVFPEATVMVHQNNAWENLEWWFTKFRDAGGKFDMIGLSHYPQAEDDMTWKTVNELALNHISTLSKLFRCKVMVVETGVKTLQNEEEAALALKDFISKARQMEECVGAFYWEPQTDGTWKPACYDKLSWRAYDMGAFRNGRPTSVMDAFK